MRKLINKIRSIRKTDPFYSCEVFKNIGCAHVDGLGCDMNNCMIRDNYQLQLIGPGTKVKK